MRLDQFLKWQGWVGTGGEAKMLIQAGEVLVNDCVVTQRGRQLNLGDHVKLAEIRLWSRRSEAFLLALERKLAAAEPQRTQAWANR